MGMVDLAPVIRDMLNQVTNNVTSLVFCNPEQGDWFDDLGCLDTDRWHEAILEIDESDILVADQPGDQARMVADSLRELNGNFAIEDITVTVPDQRLISHISRWLSDNGIRSRDVGGHSIGNSRPFVLLELLSRWLQSETFEAFAALVRHPDVYDWLVA